MSEYMYAYTYNAYDTLQLFQYSFFARIRHYSYHLCYKNMRAPPVCLQCRYIDTKIKIDHTHTASLPEYKAYYVVLLRASFLFSYPFLLVAIYIRNFLLSS